MPDPAYHLSPDDRARVLPRFDVDALERLLALTRPDLRAEFLRSFLPRERGEQVGWLAKIHDPVLQEVLEEVWAPFWDNIPDEILEIDDPGALPGRKIALERRAKRRSEEARASSKGAIK